MPTNQFSPIDSQTISDCMGRAHANISDIARIMPARQNEQSQQQSGNKESLSSHFETSEGEHRENEKKEKSLNFSKQSTYQYMNGTHGFEMFRLLCNIQPYNQMVRWK